MTKENVVLNGTGDQELDRLIQIAGYSYDVSQDIFISNLDSWQRTVGYCGLYNEATAPLGMIIDTESIYFEYQGKKWMIGLWKGQYDLVAGGEIGIYTGAFDLDIPGVFKGTFYNAVTDSNLLQMSYTLKRNGQFFFSREGKHWWLTGFKLGEFTEPNELTMEISITLDTKEMRDAFIVGMKNTGYQEHQILVNDNTVSFTFDVPYTKQPITRTPQIDWVMQRKNELLCKTYQEITEPYTTFPEKVKAIKEQAPEIYEEILKLGKNKKAYELFILIIMVGTLFISRKGFVAKEDVENPKLIE